MIIGLFVFVDALLFAYVCKLVYTIWNYEKD